MDPREAHAGEPAIDGGAFFAKVKLEFHPNDGSPVHELCWDKTKDSKC